MAGRRDNQGKLRVGLVPTAAIRRLAEVLEFGAEKYGEYNWRAGGPNLSLVKILESLERHLLDLKDGIDYDKETGLHQIGHMLCNCAFIAQLLEDGTLIDDRYKSKVNKVEKEPTANHKNIDTASPVMPDPWEWSHYQITEDETQL